jgi:hypothetical protein
LRIYDRALTKRSDFLRASAILRQSILTSIGTQNVATITDPVHGATVLTIPIILNHMRLLYGTPTADDIAALKTHLHTRLTAPSDFPIHVQHFRSAAAKHDAINSPTPPYELFLLFVNTIKHHPAIANSLTMYYAFNPDHTTHTVATVCTHLTTQLPLIRSLSTPLAGSASALPPKPSRRSRAKYL